MKLPLRLMIAAMACVGCWLVSPTAQARTLSQIISSGKLIAGINPNFYPLGEYNAQNEIVGFDVDLAQKIAGQLGVKLEIVKTPAPERVPFLVSDKVDVMFGGLTRTPDRAKVVDFTVPVLTESFSVLTFANKPFKTWRDLDSSSVTLVQIRGTTPIPFIQEALPKAKVLLLSDYPDAIRALAQGRADAIVDVVDYFGQWTQNYKKDWKILPIEGRPVDYDCLGVAQGNNSLRLWLNVALFQLEEDGFMDTLHKKWFGRSMTYPVKAQPYF